MPQQAPKSTDNAIMVKVQPAADNTARQFADVPDDERELITSGNSARIYRL